MSKRSAATKKTVPSFELCILLKWTAELVRNQEKCNKQQMMEESRNLQRGKYEQKLASYSGVR
jgi:hypothetical protein